MIKIISVVVALTTVVIAEASNHLFILTIFIETLIIKEVLTAVK